MSIDPHTAELVTAAARRTAKAPSYLAWHSVAQMARNLAAALRRENPASREADDMDRICSEASNNALDMEPDPIEQKREQATAYLRERGIYRAEARCSHQYKACPHTPPPPRFDVSPSGIQPRQLGDIQ